MHNFKYNDVQWDEMLVSVKKTGKKRRFIKKVKIVSGTAIMLLVFTFSMFYTLNQQGGEKNNMEKYSKELLSKDEDLYFAMYLTSLDNVIYDDDLGAIEIY